LRANEDGIRSTFDNGILTVSVPVNEVESAEKHGGLTHISSRVFVVKPSLRELGELREYFGRDRDTEADQFAATHELIERGVTQAVVVSLGSAGALVATSTRSQRFSAIPVRSVSESRPARPC
jgi:fructose-1-phosphate kinase PfkB-like protein